MTASAQEHLQGDTDPKNVDLDEQNMEDRVNNRTLRPNSPAFQEFMTTGWQAQEPQICLLYTSDAADE